jgi:uncharacterized protein YqhQ
MNRLHQFLRLLVATQLLPVLENGEETTLVGGQAVFEGVMMRSPHAWAISVRKPSGEIVTHSEPLERPSDRHRWMRWPLVRGVVTLGNAMALGFRATKYSVNVLLDQLPREEGTEPVQISGWMATVNILISLGFFIFLYKFVPLVATTGLKRIDPRFGNQIWFNLADGVIRIALFLLFIWGISLFGDIRRLYQYHGAEHKTVFCFEAGDPMEIAAAQKFVTWHPRCGTSFLITVLLISIPIYMLFPVTHFWARFALRIALLPFIAGLAYEMIRYAARKRSSFFALLTRPGLWLQRITTKAPADDQVECAISALNQSMEIERAQGGELVIA